MKPFLDTGFLLSLVLEMRGSQTAWQLSRRFNEPLHLAHLQRFHLENRLQREIENAQSTAPQRAVAAGALNRLRRYVDELVFQSVPLEYDVALHLAGQWQKQLSGDTPPALLLLWPALAVTAGATHFFSFDPRPRQLAHAAGLKLVPERL